MEFASKLGDYIDLDNFACYMAITAWLADIDGILGPGQNYYVYLHPKTQKFMFIPWDQDQSFGQFPRGSQEQRENLSIQRPWSGDNRFLAKVFRAEPFRNLYLAKMREFNETLFQPAGITSKVDELASVIRDAIKEESTERLTDLDNTLAGKNVTSSVDLALMPRSVQSSLLSKRGQSLLRINWKENPMGSRSGKASAVRSVRLAYAFEP